MANFSGQPQQINRFLGFCDEDDPSNLPIGLAALCRNCDFSLTSVMTRAGINTAIQGLNPSPISGILGIVYTPENAAQSFYQTPLLFDMTGALQIEQPVGSGITKQIATTLLPALPANSHMIGAQAYNKGWLAFSNLITPTAPCAVYIPQPSGNVPGSLVPYGQKPYGWTWIANTVMVVGEVGTPTASHANRHNYKVIGVTGNAQTGNIEPTWPTGGGAIFTDGNVTWQESTPSYTQVYPCYPPSPTWVTTGGAGGSWPVGNDGNADWIYFVFTYVTPAGETDVLKAFVGAETPDGNFYSGGPPETGSQSYTISCPNPPAAPPGFPGYVPTGWNLYIALAPDGSQGIPASTSFFKWNAAPLPFNTPQTVLGQITTHGDAPTNNTANIVGAGNCDAAESLPDAQLIIGSNGPSGIGSLYEFGIRYAAIMFVDANNSVSGFTQASCVPVLFYTNGSTILANNLPAGPLGTQMIIVAFTPLQFDPPSTNLPQYPLGERWAPVSIGTSAGPYFYIGNISTVTGQGFVFPATTLSDNYSESAMPVVGGPTSAYYSYTDPFLISYNDVTDRLRVIWPYPCVDLYYSGTLDRLIQTGVPGFNGHWVSLADDPESYYVDSGFIPTQNADGERAICARDFRGVTYSLRERSGYTMQIESVDDVGNPTWRVEQRWDKVGPCGPRAVDVCGRFMIFVHRSGIFKYSQEEPEPVKVSKELKYWWQTINWQAAQTIWCAIDEEKHVVRIGVPTGMSQVPNQEILIYYEEGWNTPIHFSTYSGKEISMDSARRIAINDVQAFVGKRIERNVPVPNDPVNNRGPLNLGSDGITQLSSDWYTSQFLYGSAGPDGTVQAITPGIWNDNGAGIDWQYEGMSVGILLSFCKIEGMSLNARGNGTLFASFLSGRNSAMDWLPPGSPEASNELKMLPIQLNINDQVGISRKVPSKFGERWRTRFTNGKVPDAWAELKFEVIFVIPFASDRPESQG